MADAQAVDDRLIGRDMNEDGRWFYPTAASFGAENVFQRQTSIVINELMYHAAGVYIEEIDRLFDNNEQWIELYNVSDVETIDLSGWEFDDGISYVFPEGTMMAPDSYLVISNDPESLISSRPELNPTHVLGPFERNLSDGGENLRLLDAQGNLADELHYYDSGRWDSAADGYGASLELIDPLADNATGEVWRASAEGRKSEWQTVTISGSGRTERSENGPRVYHEFLLGLLDGGQVLVDDITVTETTETGEVRQIIQNGTFEGDSLGAEPDKWRIIGTQHGQVVVDPDDPNNQVLQLTATGPTEHMHNNAGTTLKSGDEFVDIENSSEYEISFRARWMSGSNQLNSRLYFNRLGTTTQLDRPDNGGTPGAVNSQRVDNAGPTYSGMIHSPAVPDPGQAVTVTIEADDPNGLATLNLHYAIAGGEFQTTPFALGDDGQWQATIPGQDSGVLVQFYVQGEDSLGATTMYPAAGPDSRALYRVQDGQAVTGPRHTVRILMTDEDASLLHESTNVMSNNRIGSTVIYRESEIYYDVGVRLKGSQRGRDKVVRAGFNLGFSPDALFRDVHSTVGVDRSGSGDEYSQEEIIVRQVINHAGDLPQIYDDLIHVIAPDSRHTGSAMLNMARYNDVFLDSMYVNGSAGTAYEYELIYYPTTTVGRDPEALKLPNPDSVVGLAMADQGDDKEIYRWRWLIKNNRRQDDYSTIIDALKVLGQRDSVEGYHDQLAEVLDVDQWLRSFAVTTLTGIGDNYTSGAQHNGIFYVRPSDGRVLYLPWDMDFSFTQSAAGPLLTNGELRKMVRDPGYEHAYYGHVLDIITTTLNSDYMDPWIDHFDELVPGQGHFQGFKTNVSRRAESALEDIEQAIPRVPFEMTTAGPIDAGDANTVTLSGTGWVDVREIRLAGTEVPLEIAWTTPSDWSVDVPVLTGTHDVVLEAVGFQGDIVGTQTISVTAAGESVVADSLRITEINFNPSDPVGNDLFVDNDEFEWIEVRNIGSTPIDLNGVRLIQVERQGELEGVRFTFGAQTLDPNELLVVVRNRDAFASRYGTDIRLADGVGDFERFGVFSGQIANGGETLTLVDARGELIQQFEFDDAWHRAADGRGSSLEFIAALDSARDAWNQAASWQASVRAGGTPGSESSTPGDVNGDGVFDSDDLLIAFQAGEYEDGTPGNSTWEEGDWDGDGDFTTRDLVLAFSSAQFLGDFNPPAALPVQTLDARLIESAFADDDVKLARRRSI